MWTQIFRNVTAMSQGRHLLEVLPLCIAVMLRGLRGIDAGSLIRDSFGQREVEMVWCWELVGHGLPRVLCWFVFLSPPTGHVELEGKVNGLGYGLVFQLSLDCMRHVRGMLP